MRIACFYSASAAGDAFSDLLAYAIGKLDGQAGLRGWRWIFFIEGILSVAGGIICFLCLPDSPRQSSGLLKEEEIRFSKAEHSLCTAR